MHMNMYAVSSLSMAIKIVSQTNDYADFPIGNQHYRKQTKIAIRMQSALRLNKQQYRWENERSFTAVITISLLHNFWCFWSSMVLILQMRHTLM